LNICVLLKEADVIKDVLTNLAVDESRHATLDYAISVAREFDAHLDGIAFAYEPIEPGAVFDRHSVSIIGAQRLANERAAQTAVKEFEEATGKNGLSAQGRIVPSSIAASPNIFARLARVHDLSIVAQGGKESSTPDSSILEAALFDTGRPVLIVPYIQSEQFKVERVLLCWDGSPNAARAVADALPILERADNIDVITIATKEDNRKEIAGADIAHHLARHGLRIDLQRLISPDLDIANTMLSYAADRCSDLIVMGGYGHSRLREFILGGATRGILASMTVPTLMSH
jgi:nucleotide-binding universal stress UspA family protein